VLKRFGIAALVAGNTGVADAGSPEKYVTAPRSRNNNATSNRRLSIPRHLVAADEPCASARPVIASDRRNPEVFGTRTSSNGLLVPTFDVAALAEALEEVFRTGQARRDGGEQQRRGRASTAARWSRIDGALLHLAKRWTFALHVRQRECALNRR